jgi:hypothetical protein
MNIDTTGQFDPFDHLLKRDPKVPVRANDTQVAGTHYKDMGVEPWDVIDTWPIEQQVGAYRAGILKYVMRMGTKDEQAQEIRKCGHYCMKLAEVLESMQHAR